MHNVRHQYLGSAIAEWPDVVLPLIKCFCVDHNTHLIRNEGIRFSHYERRNISLEFQIAGVGIIRYSSPQSKKLGEGRVPSIAPGSTPLISIIEWCTGDQEHEILFIRL